MRLYGRRSEIEKIDRLLASARAGKSGAVVLRGEPGIGKTSLLDYAVKSAEAMTVLRARGLELEANLAFSGLSDLVAPILGELYAIPRPQAAALAGALGIRSAVSSERFVVCLATLRLVAAAAEQRPVLLAVDDMQWLDSGSRDAVLFAARRFEAERVAVVATTRDVGDGEGRSGIDEVEIAGLDSDAARALLAERLPHRIAPGVAERLLAASSGNPLALVELAHGLSESQLAGVDPLGDPLPVVTRVERAFLRRIALLPRETQEALLVAAASYGTAREIDLACRALGLSTDVLHAAEQANVIRRRDGRISFSHPVLRAGVYHSASPEKRSRAHEALASALNASLTEDGRAPSAIERYAWQLAAATQRPSESVALALERGASSARSRGGYASSATALERAAQLSPSSEHRVRRLLIASRDSQLAGHGNAALRLADEALADCTDDRMRGELQLVRAQVKTAQGELAVARELLEAEARRVATFDRARAVEMFAEAAGAACGTGDIAAGLELSRQAHRQGRREGGIAEVVGDAVLGAVLVNSGDISGDDLLIRHLPRLVEETPPLIIVQMLPGCLLYMERFDEARAMLDRLISSAQALGAPSVALFALPWRAELGYRVGDWFAGAADATQALALARETNQGLEYALCFSARIEAARGVEKDCREHAAEALEIAAALGHGRVLTRTHALLGRLELGLGHVEKAVVELEAAHRLTTRHGLGEPSMIQELPDLIEAYVRLGRANDSTAALEKFQRDAARTGRAWGSAVAARCRGFTAATSFDDEFEKALSWHAKIPMPFERARTELCYGERLRRARRGREARAHLHAALETFDRLDAAPWEARARRELAATGEIAQSRESDQIRELTPQELQLASIVARGATNREAAAALFVSPKTIEAHLHRIYVKLGIRSRTELAHQLARERPREIRP